MQIMNSSLHIFPSAPLPEESDTESVVEAIPHTPLESPSAQVDEELKDAAVEEVGDEEHDEEEDNDEEMLVYGSLRSGE